MNARPTPTAPDPLADLATAPEAWDFFAAIHRVQAEHPDAPGPGRARRIEDEPLRIGQRPSLRFEPSPVVAVRRAERGGRPVVEVEQVAFGPFGPAGALPLHVTDDAIREARAGRPWLRAFLDLFTHRLTGFLYRVWESARPAASRARGTDDPWPVWISSLFGMGPPAFRDRDALPDDARRVAAGWLAAGRRSAAAVEGVAAVVTGHAATVEPFVPEWLPMPPAEQARLGTGCATLGADTVLGPRFWSVQQRFRLRTEPLDYPAFAALLPDGPLHMPLRAGVTSVMGLARVWELNPVLRGDAVPPLRLDGARRLGWETWMAGGDAMQPAADVTLS